MRSRGYAAATIFRFAHLPAGSLPRHAAVHTGLIIRFGSVTGSPRLHYGFRLQLYTPLVPHVRGSRYRTHHFTLLRFCGSVRAYVWFCHCICARAYTVAFLLFCLWFHLYLVCVSFTSYAAFYTTWFTTTRFAHLWIAVWFLRSALPPVCCCQFSRL